MNPFQHTVLSDEQKNQIDELIVLFNQKKIAISEMYSRIEQIKYGFHDSHVFSNLRFPENGSGMPVHIP